MKTTWFILLLISPLLLFSQNFKGKATGKERIESSNKAFEKEILFLVNEERKKRNLAPLVLKSQLIYAARYHAKDMAIDNYMGHESKDLLSDGSYQEVCGTIERVKLFVDNTFLFCAENVAVGQESPKEVMDSWMRSPGHRQNIINKKNKYIGIAYIYTDKNFKHYWVQDFGR